MRGRRAAVWRICVTLRRRARGASAEERRCGGSAHAGAAEQAGWAELRRERPGAHVCGLDRLGQRGHHLLLAGDLADVLRAAAAQKTKRDNAQWSVRTADAHTARQRAAQRGGHALLLHPRLRHRERGRRASASGTQAVLSAPQAAREAVETAARAARAAHGSGERGGQWQRVRIRTMTSALAKSRRSCAAAPPAHALRCACRCA